MARVSSAPRLEELVREREVLSTLKASVPHAWKILEHEIGRARLAAAAASDRASSAPSTRPAVRKRVKLRVPAEQYPDYNFVGRLLGPRGATLKRLERDTACRIMIRGKGSIRKDKEADVRGKPGWEHVFHEPLHVVIEVVDAADDAAASRILARAKDLVELLLVPVPEERDSLKRAQLRDLAILNGTHRSVADLLSNHHHHGLQPSPPRASPSGSPPPLRRAVSTGGKQGMKHSYAPTDPYVPAFEPGVVSFARPYTSSAQRSSASPLPPAASSPPQPHHAYPPASSAFGPGSPQDHYALPDLEKLRIPSLDFDHLNESNLTLHSFGMPAASPTIVDPDIYPYPPTPGLLNVDHQIQLNAFASPVWTPSRSMSSGLHGSNSSALPPRSPHALDTGHQGGGNSFLLGRALGDPARHQGAFRRSKSAREPGELSFEQAFASQSIGEREPNEFSSNHQQFAAARDPGTTGQSVLANFFPSSPLAPHVSQVQEHHDAQLELRHQQAQFVQQQHEEQQQVQRQRQHQQLLHERQQQEQHRERQAHEQEHQHRDHLQHEPQGHLEQLHREHSKQELDHLRHEQAEQQSQHQTTEHHHHH